MCVCGGGGGGGTTTYSKLCNQGREVYEKQYDIGRIYDNYYEVTDK